MSRRPTIGVSAWSGVGAFPGSAETLGERQARAFRVEKGKRLADGVSGKLEEVADAITAERRIREDTPHIARARPERGSSGADRGRMWTELRIVLVLQWRGTRTTLVLHWYGADTPIGPALVLHWYGIGPLFVIRRYCTTWALCWCCTGTTLVRH